MSIIVAFTSGNTGCVATDSQQTELKTRVPDFNAVKSKRIAHDLVVGYAGHTVACEWIIGDATKHFHVSDKNFVDKFYGVLNEATMRFHAKYFNNSRQDGKFYNSFLVVGYTDNGLPMILTYGTATSYQVLASVPIDNSPITFAFLPPPPDDIDPEICSTIATETIKECAPDYPIHRIADIVIQKVADQSQWCGGKTQILEIQNHLQV